MIRSSVVLLGVLTLIAAGCSEPPARGGGAVRTPVLVIGSPAEPTPVTPPHQDIHGSGGIFILYEDQLDAGAEAELVWLEGRNLLVQDGDANQARLGSAVALGPRRINGPPDIVAGAPGGDLQGSEDVGTAILFDGETARELHRFHGEVAGDRFGSAVAIGDFSGDGIYDIAVGAPMAEVAGGPERPGRVYLFDGATFERVAVLDGENDEDRFGASVALGDVDNDGLADVVVGAPGVDRDIDADVGLVYVFSGANRDIVHQIAGLAAEEQFGFSVLTADVDPEPGRDLIVSTIGSDRNLARFGVFSSTDWSPIYQAAGNAGLGASLATGLLTDDQNADILTSQVDTNTVLAVDVAVARTFLRIGQERVPAGQPVRSFGEAVAIRDLYGDELPEVIVGDPDGGFFAGDVPGDADAPRGLVHVFDISDLRRPTHLLSFEGMMAGGRFGAVLATWP